MKFPGLGIPMQDKVPIYLALLFALTVLVMILFKIPTVLTSWEDAARFQKEFRIGIAGIIFFAIIAIWVYIHRREYRRIERFRLGILFMLFFFNPVFSFISLAITSNGFKESPAVLGSEQLYKGLDEIQFFIFISVVIGTIIWFARRRSQATKIENPESAGEQLF